MKRRRSGCGAEAGGEAADALQKLPDGPGNRGGVVHDVETQSGEAFKQGYFAERPAGQLFLHDEAADEGEGPVLRQELLDDIGTQIIFFHAAVERGQIENVSLVRFICMECLFCPAKMPAGRRTRSAVLPPRSRKTSYPGR